MVDNNQTSFKAIMSYTQLMALAKLKVSKNKLLAAQKLCSMPSLLKKTACA